MNYLKKFKQDPVLYSAWTLALISAFFVRPDKSYLDYIDFRSLGILWGLMVIIQGLKENSVFEKIGQILMQKVDKSWQLAAALIFMCFFGSMLITNDVALITFVPFGMLVLKSCKREDMMIPVVALQTIAANLGSMSTPIGNPQNLYLYGTTGMKLGEFVGCMLPYTIAAALLLLVSLVLIPGKNEKVGLESDHMVVKNFGSKIQIGIYAVLFVIALLSVLRVLPWCVMAIIVLVVVGGMDFKILLRADYLLILTFIGFFIFTGNMARIDAVSEFLKNITAGKEFTVAVIASQFISNVPATLMLSGFSTDYKELLIGVNAGGLGTLIASMASLISFKFYSSAYKDNQGKYIAYFTVANIIFLACFVVMHYFL
ncbi:SLC13 family permease [Butyrivibrio sp. YAB3001]|uniref:SLC13 family permease n=1 Tax=Butyrivibrio sp. YAB3001 TaxID=1520812 RepID=UPI0008F664A3|nr:SLC13 family permease [Butyrivibrio sp. YAB3001]SFC20093.1 Na+/H+ antiporter NhaD [Butyrivibrio sp. YAB3001]